mgnify:CR=1 FL=1
MSSTPLISLDAVRKLKQSDPADQEYHAKILVMDKLELLEEMVRFQEERSRLGHLTPTMMVRGQMLFKALENQAATRELQMLARSYRRHLDHELREFRQTGKINPLDAEEASS